MSETDTTAMKPRTSTPSGALKQGDANGEGGIGHNLPQEAPQAFATAVVDVDGF